MKMNRRLGPSLAAGLVAWLVYTVIANAVQASAGVPYTDWFKTAGNAWRIGVLSLAAGSAFLVAFVLVTRWDHLWRDPVRLPVTKVMKVAIVLWWIAIAVRLAGVRWGEVPMSLLAAVVASGVLVGFAEETLFRGLFLRGLREGGRAESTAAIGTAIAFGLFHLPNVFMGTGAIGLVQVVIAALSGSLLYVFRRYYGTIVPAMVAHGAWDISTFLAVGYPADWLTPVSLSMQVVFIVLGTWVLVDLYRNDRGTVAIRQG